MSSEPPPFQEALRCVICNCSFNTFRRRHHCRCCGRTLCAEHSSNHKALPQFGIYTCVRVCSDCFNCASRVDDPQIGWNRVNDLTDTVSRLEISAVEDEKMGSAAGQSPSLGISECKCGMPLCICEAPVPSTNSVTLQNKTTSSLVAQTTPKPRKTNTISKNTGSTSNNSLGNVSNVSLEKTQMMDYEVSGEGLREAIKNSDNIGVKKLLSEGVDANYCDKQGSSLLHLAAVFNQSDIAMALMEYGAKVDFKNSQGETPLDCAPAMLQYKMQKKMQQQANSVEQLSC